MQKEALTALQKALEINLNPKIYGTFAEIGAGQEVVRTFFRAGGAAGTVAKSMSAYDMAFSDAIYGQEKDGRFVCESRLVKMLDKEYGLIQKRLPETKAKDSTYFVFADTVAARSFKFQKKEGHGWLGIKYQLEPLGPISSIHVHVRLFDKENAQQQVHIGTVGTNLIYGAFYYYKDPLKLIHSLLDHLPDRTVEVDMVKFSGPAFEDVDNRIIGLQMVEKKITDAVIFSPEGALLLPSEVLYKRPVLVQRGSYRPPTYLNMDVNECSLRKFLEEPLIKDQRDKAILLKEITIHNLTESSQMNHQDFLDRIDLLGSLGNSVLVSNYFEYYRLTNFLGRNTNQFVGVALGMVELHQLFDEKHYATLEGGLLEAFGKLLNRQIRLYIYPQINPKSGSLETAHTFDLPKHIKPLYDYLYQNSWIVALEDYHPEYLKIFSKDVLKQIQSGDEAQWEKAVPPSVSHLIKKRGLFGYKKKVA